MLYDGFFFLFVNKLLWKHDYEVGNLELWYPDDVDITEIFGKKSIWSMNILYSTTVNKTINLFRPIYRSMNTINPLEETRYV